MACKQAPSKAGEKFGEQSKPTRAKKMKRKELGKQSEWGRVREPVNVAFDANLLLVIGLSQFNQEGNIRTVKIEY